MSSQANPPRVLIVDDEIDTADALALIFQMRGFDASVARGGQAAVSLASLNAPDVIVTDIRMPVLDGRALAHAIRSATGETDFRPILVAFSGLPASTVEDGMPSPFDLWFTKPQNLDALVTAVSRLLEARRGVVQSA